MTTDETLVIVGPPERERVAAEIRREAPLLLTRGQAQDALDGRLVILTLAQSLRVADTALAALHEEELAPYTWLISANRQWGRILDRVEQQRRKAVRSERLKVILFRTLSGVLTGGLFLLHGIPLLPVYLWFVCVFFLCLYDLRKLRL